MPDPLDPDNNHTHSKVDYMRIEAFQWDFSITTSITVFLILLYTVQLVRLAYGDCDKRNKLTLYIY